MKLGDLVVGELDDKSIVGLVVEEEEYKGESGVWIWYPGDSAWRWYDSLNMDTVRLISESR